MAKAEAFADYAQWEAWMEDLTATADSQASNSVARKPSSAQEGSADSPPATSKKKLSYMESREYSTIEQRIADAEEILAQKKAAAEDPAIATDAARLLSAHAELEAAQKKVDELFTRWSELEAKLS